MADARMPAHRNRQAFGLTPELVELPLPTNGNRAITI
jgi:hypothetical protein